VPANQQNLAVFETNGVALEKTLLLQNSIPTLLDTNKNY
jgi:hypothetical protein